MTLMNRVRSTLNRTMDTVARDVMFLKAGERIPDGRGGYTTGPATNHPCRGWIADYDDLSKLAAMRPITDRKVVILADTLAVAPTISDRVTVDGQTYRIRSVSTDPAGAAWVLQAYL